MSTRKSARKLLEKEVGAASFGMFLKSARLALDLTQEEMSEKLGVTKSVISDIERGRQLVSPTLAIKIAKKAKLSDRVAVRLCLQDQLNKAKIKMQVEVAA